MIPKKPKTRNLLGNLSNDFIESLDEFELMELKRNTLPKEIKKELKNFC